MDPAEGGNVLLKLQASELDITGSNFEYLESGNPAALRGFGVADGGARDFIKYASSAPSGDEGDHQRTFDPSLNVNMDIGDPVLTSTTGYSSFDYRNGFDRWHAAAILLQFLPGTVQAVHPETAHCITGRWQSRVHRWPVLP